MKKPVQIALFNHKGGVSKTTSVFHLGWMLSELGKKVLLVDCDPQCNLTGVVLEYGKDDVYPFETKDTKKPQNIKDALAPAFEARPIEIAPVVAKKVFSRDNLYVLPGHVGLSEYESSLAIAQELSGSLSTLQNLPGSLRHLFDITARKIKADYVLVDMSPSLGALNQNILMTSDAFIIPMAPDYFSAMALRSLARVLPKWHAWAEKAERQEVLINASYPWPNKKPVYLGSIIQNYRSRKRDNRGARPTRPYEKWFEELKKVRSEVLIKTMREIGMILSPEKRYSEAGASLDDFMMEVPDFNSLIAVSQDLAKPVFTLTRDEIKTTGSVARNQLESVDKFRDIYKRGAEKIIRLTGI